MFLLVGEIASPHLGQALADWLQDDSTPWVLNFIRQDLGPHGAQAMSGFAGRMQGADSHYELFVLECPQRPAVLKVDTTNL